MSPCPRVSASPCPRVPASPHPPLSPSQKALARSRTYAILGRLYRHGLDEETLPTIRAISQLAAALPDSFDVDEAAADHHHLFGFNVFPFQSIFLDPAGLLGGDISEQVLRFYREAGYGSGGESVENPDHIGQELGFLAFLSGAEAAAWQDNLAAAAGRMAALIGDFLDRHLLLWLSPLILAIRQQAHPFYTALADLTLDVLLDHRRDLDGSPTTFSSLPAAPKLLEDEKTSLRDIAAYLLSPPLSGIYLSRDDIGRLARKAGLPRGFGKRRDMLLNLLRSASQYDQFGQILALLQAVVTGWQEAYAEIEWAGEWQARVRETGSMLAEMAARAEQK
jgi:TorA maturation chaperone TorD